MPAIVGIGIALAAALLAFVPRALIRRGQDRLAAEILARKGNGGGPFRLLTRAERFVGAYRRAPGVLGLRGGLLVFESRFEPATTIELGAVRKISTGKLLSTGRRLFRDEVLAITDSSGTLREFQMSHASCFQWRQALGSSLRRTPSPAP